MRYLILILLLVSCGMPPPPSDDGGTPTTEALYSECLNQGEVACGEIDLLRCTRASSLVEPVRYVWLVILECHHECLPGERLVCW